MKNTILKAVSDLVSKFLYYDRKEDNDLKMGAIEKAIRKGIITEDEIVGHFRQKLHEGIGKK